MTTTAQTQVAPARGGFSQAVSDSFVVAWRNIRGGLRVPDNQIYVLVQPIMFVVLFAYVFGGAIPLEGYPPDPKYYREFLMAGIFAQTMAFSVAPASVGLADDMSKGLIDRFRALPMARSGVIAGGVISNMVTQFFVLVVMMICGVLVGWRVHEGLLSFLAGVAILLGFAFAMLWIGALIGLSVGNPQIAASAGLIWLFPVTFLSNAFVPQESLPGWLQPVVDWNPLSAVVAACRDLFGNPNPFVGDAWPMQNPVLASVLWIIVITAVFAPLAIRKYKSATSH